MVTKNNTNPRRGGFPFHRRGVSDEINRLGFLLIVVVFIGLVGKLLVPNNLDTKDMQDLPGEASPPEPADKMNNYDGAFLAVFFFWMAFILPRTPISTKPRTFAAAMGCVGVFLFLSQDLSAKFTILHEGVQARSSEVLPYFFAAWLSHIASGFFYFVQQQAARKSIMQRTSFVILTIVTSLFGWYAIVTGIKVAWNGTGH